MKQKIVNIEKDSKFSEFFFLLWTIKQENESKKNRTTPEKRSLQSSNYSEKNRNIIKKIRHLMLLKEFAYLYK